MIQWISNNLKVVLYVVIPLLGITWLVLWAILWQIKESGKQGEKIYRAVTNILEQILEILCEFVIPALQTIAFVNLLSILLNG